jgi:poly(glycerol-phosphate) alpha-glucosyltransferase
LAITGWDQGGHEVELKRMAEELGLSFVEVRDQGPEVRGQKSEATGQGAEINGPSSLYFLGPQFNEDKAACYRDCDAFILPSFSEGLPMVVLEAWAHAKPVLMTAECNLPAGFEAAAAVRIEPTAESIEAGFREVLFTASNSQLQALGQQGRALVEKRFSWPIIAGQMKEAYDWLLGHAPKPGCAV